MKFGGARVLSDDTTPKMFTYGHFMFQILAFVKAWPQAVLSVLSF